MRSLILKLALAASLWAVPTLASADGINWNMGHGTICICETLVIVEGTAREDVDRYLAGLAGEPADDLAAVPLPAAAWLMIGGVSALAGLRRLSRRRASA